ncbi:MAG TPA: septum formation initiator family protein [Candidatus Paceibacterota bacterium]
MLESYHKKKINRWLYSKWTMALLVVLIAFVAEATWDVYQKENISAANLLRIEKERDRLTERKEELEKEVASLHTERGIEKEIRAKFGVVKAGEHVVVIVGDEHTTESNKKEEPKKSFWDTIVALFK